MQRVTDIQWERFSDVEVCDKLDDVLNYGFAPLGYIAEGLVLEMMEEEPDDEKMFVWVSEIQVKVDDLRITIKRLIDEWQENILKRKREASDQTGEPESET